MSYVSQKKDISDPDVIRDFALKIGDQRRLNYLFVLTVADMCATNPDIWNSWRASLMRQLYLETKRALRRGLENLVDKQEIVEETQALALANLEAKGFTRDEIESTWQSMGDEYFIRESHLDIAHQTEALIAHESDKPLILISETTSSALEGATQIFIWAKNAPHIFMAATTCLAQLNLNIQDAKIYQSTSGHTLDTFYVLDEGFEPIGENTERYKKIHDANTSKPHIALSIGEPKHEPPAFVIDALAKNLSRVANYAATKGLPELRAAISKWACKRFNLNDLSADTQILPVNGTREGLFAITQTLATPNTSVLMPNPFYQIYEGAALLAGAEPVFLNCDSSTQFAPDFDNVTDDQWQACSLLFLCSPGNPTGTVMPSETLQKLIRLADKHNFVIAYIVKNSQTCWRSLATAWM